MFDKLFSILQRVGKSFMIPIAVLPVAGLLMGIGQSLTNETMIQTYHLQFILGKGTPLYALFTIMCSAGKIVFDNLSVLFAVVLRWAWQNMKKPLQLSLHSLHSSLCMLLLMLYLLLMGIL